MGKSTVLQKALEEIEGKYRILNFGDMMLEAALEKKIVKDRDEMRKLEPHVQKEIQKRGAMKIAKASKKENVIVDTHATIKTAKGYLPGLPKWVLDELQPDTIVVVEADAAEIKGRRKSDETH